MYLNSWDTLYKNVTTFLLNVKGRIKKNLTELRFGCKQFSFIHCIAAQFYEILKVMSNTTEPMIPHKRIPKPRFKPQTLNSPQIIT